jgi:hypothetical protein
MFVNGQSGKRQDRHPLWSDIYQEVEEARRVQGETSGPSVVKQEERLLVNEDSNVQILKIADSIQPAITKEYRGSLTNVAPVLDTDQLVKLVSDAISAKFAEMMAEQKKEICSIDSKVAQLSEQLDESTTHFIETGKYVINFASIDRKLSNSLLCMSVDCTRIQQTRGAHKRLAVA